MAGLEVLGEPVEDTGSVPVMPSAPAAAPPPLLMQLTESTEPPLLSESPLPDAPQPRLSISTTAPQLPPIDVSQISPLPAVSQLQTPPVAPKQVRHHSDVVGREHTDAARALTPAMRKMSLSATELSRTLDDGPGSLHGVDNHHADQPSQSSEESVVVTPGEITEVVDTIKVSEVAPVPETASATPQPSALQVEQLTVQQVVASPIDTTSAETLPWGQTAAEVASKSNRRETTGTLDDIYSGYGEDQVQPLNPHLEHESPPIGSGAGGFPSDSTMGRSVFPGNDGGGGTSSGAPTPQFKDSPPIPTIQRFEGPSPTTGVTKKRKTSILRRTGIFGGNKKDSNKEDVKNGSTTSGLPRHKGSASVSLGSSAQNRALAAAIMLGTNSTALPTSGQSHRSSSQNKPPPPLPPSLPPSSSRDQNQNPSQGMFSSPASWRAEFNNMNNGLGMLKPAPRHSSPSGADRDSGFSTRMNPR